MLAASLPDFFFDSLVSDSVTPHFSSLYTSTESFACKDTINDMTLWKPHSTSRSNWVSKTDLPFDPFESATVLQHQELLCPKCKAVISVCEYQSTAATPCLMHTQHILRLPGRDMPNKTSLIPVHPARSKLQGRDSQWQS